MNFESAGARVLLVAAGVGADERLEARVSELMSLQVALRDELHITLLTLERSLARVRAHVRLKVSSFGELLEAGSIGTKKQLYF